MLVLSLYPFCTPVSPVSLCGVFHLGPFLPCLEVCSLGVAGEKLGMPPRGLFVVQIPLIPDSAGSLKGKGLDREADPWCTSCGEEGCPSLQLTPIHSRTLGLVCTDCSLCSFSSLHVKAPPSMGAILRAEVFASSLSLSWACYGGYLGGDGAKEELPEECDWLKPSFKEATVPRTEICKVLL